MHFHKGTSWKYKSDLPCLISVGLRLLGKGRGDYVYSEPKHCAFNAHLPGAPVTSQPSAGVWNSYRSAGGTSCQRSFRFRLFHAIPDFLPNLFIKTEM